jgi:hypothetical protein
MIKLQLINADILSSGTPRTFPQVNKLGERREDFRMDIEFFFVITGQDYPCQHIDQWPRKTRESTTALATKKKKACVRIKRVKTELFNLRTYPRMDYAFCLLHIEKFWKLAIPIIWCYMYMQLQSPNSTLRYTIFNIH